MLSIVVACALLCIAVLVDSFYFEIILKHDIQVVLGTLVIAVILFDSPIAGLIMGLAVIIMYMRAYGRSFGVTFNLFDNNRNALAKKYPMKSLVTKYITPENLKDAQDNVVDDNNMKAEIKGVKGVYGEQVYGAQGQDKVMPGLTSYTLYGKPL